MPTGISVEIDKQAEAHPKVHDLIRSRWSPRAFSSREVSTDDLTAILDAGRWAASSMNEQPWRILVARRSDRPTFERMLHVLVPANQEWASKAPILLMTVAKKTFARTGAPNHHALHDAGQALAQMMLQATALGLHSHAMAGYDHQKARTDLGIPDDYELGAMVALGYLGTPDELPEQKRQMELAPRQRKPLNEIVFGSHWNERLAL